MINDNVCFFLAFVREKLKKWPLLLLCVNFRHFCGYLEIKGDGCFYVLVEIICFKGPPGETDFKYVHLFRQLSPTGNTVEQEQLDPQQEVKSAHEGTKLHLNISGCPPASLHFSLVSSLLTSWEPSQRGSAECWLAANDESRRPNFDRKTQPCCWLNPVGSPNQNPACLIANWKSQL